MEKSLNKVQLLIEEGERFTYDNFSLKGEFGYPSSFSPDWVAWQSRVTGIITKLFGGDSAPFQMLKAGLKEPVIGNGSDHFEQSKAYFLGALKSAADVLREDIFDELKKEKAEAPANFSNEIFIVHGHDEKSKNELSVFLTEIGLEPIILHRKPDEGQTVIEKFEKHSNVGYAFIILTPDEVAYLADQQKLDDAQRQKEKRARPNVLFEFGYFIGKLGRKRVCCLYTGDVVIPSDLGGLLYKKFQSSIEEVAYGIVKELKEQGYKLA